MGEEQRLSPEEQLATAREAFEDGTDFSVAVEEEFALLDPDSLGLVNRGGDRAIAVHNALRCFLPELLALSASSPFVEAVNTGLHSARTQIFTRTFPRCGIPDAYDDWRGFEDYVAFLYRTGSISEHTQLWWSVRPHLAYPTVELRIMDGQPDLAEAQSLAALAYALAVRCMRALDEGERLPDVPRRLLEENMWRAIRHGLAGELI